MKSTIWTKCEYYTLFFEEYRNIVDSLDTLSTDMQFIKPHTSIYNPNIRLMFKHKTKMTKKTKIDPDLKYEVRTFDIDVTLRDALPVLKEVLEKFGVYLVDIVEELNMDPKAIILCFSDEPMTQEQLKKAYLVNEL